MPLARRLFRLLPAAGAALLAVPAFSQPFSTFLKASATIHQVVTSATGDIYVLAEVPGNGQDVFVASLNAAATRFNYQATFGGSGLETANGLAVDAAGNAYIVGTTRSADFPALPRSTGPLPSDARTSIPFIAKLDKTGAVDYATLYTNGAPAVPSAIVVNGQGQAIVSGWADDSTYPATAGAYNNRWVGTPPFVTKLDATGTRILFSAVGVGGTALALDASGNILVAGSDADTLASNGRPLYPTTPGAFQTTYKPYYYIISPGGGFVFQAGEQYISKLSADGSQLLYSTFVTASRGATNSGLAVDSAGNAWVTGSTASTDYPYTIPATATSQAGTFVSELDPTGSKLLLSVPQGGTGIALDPQGNPVVAGSFPTTQIGFPGLTNSPPVSYPPFGNTPATCLAQGDAALPHGAFAMRISRQDGAILGGKVVAGASLTKVISAVDSLGNIYVAGSSGLPDTALTPGVVFDTAVSARTVPGIFLVRTDLSPAPIACVTDSTDSTPIGPVAPGQLITLYGNGLGPKQGIAGLTDAGTPAPVTQGGVIVTFDGVPAPLLYVSSGQINVQVPFEVGQNPSATTIMQLTWNGNPLGSRLFAVIPRNPSLFVGPPLPSAACGSGIPFAALALNQDGSINSCANPAKAGTDLTLFVNGLGVDASNQLTGRLTRPNPPYISVPVSVFWGYYSQEVDSFTDQPGAISGLGRILFRVPPLVPGTKIITVTLNVNGVTAGPLVPGNAAATSSPLAVYVAP